MAQPPSRLVWYPGHELLLNEIVRAENCSLFDSQGKRFVDLESGVWCTSVGHGHPRILSVIAEQSSKIAHTGFGYSSGIVDEAADEILALLGLQNGRCVFLCSGSEAVEYGVRVAQAVSDRSVLMTMTDSYFGAYGSASKQQEDEWFRFDWAPCADCPHADDCSERCEHWATIPFERIGGFLFEPGSSSGLVRFPPEKLIRGIERAIRENDGLVLVNEVTTGVGRTGTWFGYQHYDVSPDIVALGKGIGNGYPVSVAAFAPGVIERLGGEPPKYAQSHQNDPLGAAVAREVVRIIRDEGLLERAAKTAALLLNGLDEIRAREDRIREIRARGLMLVIELDDDAELTLTARTHRELVRRGFVVARRPGAPALRLDPALTVERDDIAGFLEALGGILAEANGTA